MEGIIKESKTNEQAKIYSSVGNRVCKYLLPAMLIFLSVTTYAQTGTRWQMLPGFARDIGAGAEGSIWAIGSNHAGNAFDYGIYKWTGNKWEGIDGGGVRIDVDGKGIPWIINNVGQIYRRNNNSWDMLPGLAKDIGIGADGSVWIIGIKPSGNTGDFDIYKWSGSNWELIDGGGVRIDVDGKGNPWIINSVGQIFKRTNNHWDMIPGQGKDIGVGSDDSVWIIGTNPVANSRDYSIYRWIGNSWKEIDGGGVQITVNKSGLPLIVNSRGNVYERK